MTSKHVLITGGAGFIGSHVTANLLDAGHQVTVVDNLISGYRRNLPQHARLKFLHKNLLSCQPEDFRHPIDGIVHLAATASVESSWSDPLATHQNNLSATLITIQLCRVLQIPRLVFASSAAVYGNCTQLPISESCATQPISPYGMQKLFGEQYASLFAKKFRFSFVGLRFFNVFGPRQSPNSPYSGVISIFFKAMRGNSAIAIYGDGQQTRDFIYVQDVASAVQNALQTPLESGSSLICNIGTGKTTSVLKLIDILQNCFPQWGKKIKFATPRTGDIRHSQANIDLARTRLNFTPQWSIESGIKHLVQTANIE